MVTSATSLAWLYLLSVLVYLSAVSAVPVATSQAKSSSPPPKFAVYADESLFGIPNVSDLKGFNYLILSFILAKGAADEASLWAQLSPSERRNIKDQYNAAGIKILASAFGSTETPTTAGKDPTSLAQQMAGFVQSFDLDGIDVDYEDFPAVGNGLAFDWLSTFTTVLRDNLPQERYIITHAPVAPWFGQNQLYHNLHKSVGHLIDWYNVQFYSQGAAYTSCDTLISNSAGDFPGTSVLEIVQSGVPQEKVVLGKPATAALVGDPAFSGGGGGTGVASEGTQMAGGTQVAGGGTQVASGDTQVAGGDTQVAGGGTQVASGGTRVASGGTLEAGGGTLEANGGSFPPRLRHRNSGPPPDPHRNGFLEPDVLAQCLMLAKKQGWSAGVMVWEFPDGSKDWIKTVRHLTWPVGKA